jgi:WD40 repeat protein
MECIGMLDDSEDSVLCMILSKEGLLFSASSDRSIRCWNVKKRKCLYIIKDVHRERVSSIVLDDKDHLISASTDKHIKVWSLNEEEAAANDGKSSRMLII